MGIYDELGVRTVINVGGANTRLGGALVSEDVIDAMAEAAKHSVDMMDLHAVASKVISEITGSESGFVTCGAAAALTQGTAAIITGLDIARMDRMPDTRGMKNEVIMAREQRNGYDHAIRAAGATLVEVGMNEIFSGAGVRATEAWEYEVAINENTAAIAYFYRPGSMPDIQEVINVAKKHSIPVLVDAAGQLPPAENLRKFIGMGADLVSFSGGKAIRGPQNSGILAGKKDLIASVFLQHLDLDDHFDIWDPPSGLISKEDLPGIPRHGIGRGFKVSKESIVGLLTALNSFSKDGNKRTSERFYSLLISIEKALTDLPHLKLDLVQSADPEVYPTLEISIDEQKLGSNAFEISRKLKYEGDPLVYVGETKLSLGILTINPMNLNENRAEMATKRIREVLSNRRST